MKKLAIILFFLPLCIKPMNDPNAIAWESPYGQGALHNSAPEYQSQAPWYHSITTPQEVEHHYRAQGHDINIQDTAGDTLLIYALKKKIATLAWYLLTCPEIDLTIKDSAGHNANYYAFHGNLEYLWQEINRLEKHNQPPANDERLLVYWYDALFHIPSIRYFKSNFREQTKQDIVHRLVSILNTQDSAGDTALNYFVEYAPESAEQLLDYIRDNREFCDSDLLLSLSTPNYAGLTAYAKAVLLHRHNEQFIKKIKNAIAPTKFQEEIKLARTVQSTKRTLKPKKLTYDQQLVTSWLSCLAKLSNKAYYITQLNKFKNTVKVPKTRTIERSFEKRELIDLIVILNKQNSQGDTALNHFVQYFPNHADQLFTTLVSCYDANNTSEIISTSLYRLLNFREPNYAGLTPFRKALYYRAENDCNDNFILNLIERLSEEDLIEELDFHATNPSSKNIFELIARHMPSSLELIAKKIIDSTLSIHTKKMYVAQAFKFAALYAQDFYIQIFQLYQQLGGTINDLIDGYPVIIHCLMHKKNSYLLIYRLAAEKDCPADLRTLTIPLDVNIPDHNGFTPLMIAIYYKRDLETAQLCKLGADLYSSFCHKRTKRWITAYGIAVDLKNAKALEILIENGLDTSRISTKTLRLMNTLLEQQQQKEEQEAQERAYEYNRLEGMSLNQNLQ